MSGRYAAFTFVDRITSLVPGIAATGTFHIPAGVTGFPSSLLAEATGQLAAWVAVSKLGFRLRPVAGIARETVYAGVPAPGDTLHTEVVIHSCEDDAVAYDGWASIGSAKVLEIRDCVGPMLPLETFDDPATMRAFFDTLCGAGARPDRFGGVTPVPLTALRHEGAGRSATATLDVPQRAPFFDDHFPRRPVFPGTLLLDRMTALASVVVADATGGAPPVLRRVTDVKLRAFIEAGARLELRATAEERSQNGAGILIEARAEGQRRPVGNARVEFEVKR